MTNDFSPEAQQLAQNMMDAAKRKKAALPVEQQIIIDAIVLAETIRDNTLAPRQVLSHLRGTSMKYAGQRGTVMLRSYMDILADHIDGVTHINH